MNKENVLGFNVCNTNLQELTDIIFNDFNNNVVNFIVNINPEIIMNNYKNNELINTFNKENYQIPDGIGIVWASKKLKGSIKTRITGIDLMQNICKNSSSNNGKIFLYGSKPGISEKAKLELEKSYENINIVGTCNGYESADSVISLINNSGANILFVGLGNPKQEEFILNNKNKLPNIKIFMPIGGSLDVISKTLKRAPNWIIKCNLEWLYRIIRQPKRFFRSFKLIKFVFLILFKKGEKKNG